MTNVSPITPHLKNVQAPAAIRDLPAWVIWRFEAQPGKAKPRKVPYYANGGKRHGEQGSPRDIESLVTFDAARAAAARRGFDGVGFATLQQFGICALDFDDCIHDGEIHPEVEALLGDSYAEFSPSGQGIRVFFQGNLGNGKSVREGPFGMECFSTAGYVTFTGNMLDITELLGNEDVVAPITPQVRALHLRRFDRRQEILERVQGDALGLTEAQIRGCLDALPTDMHYDDWLQVGMAIHCETHGEGFELWEEWSQRSGKYGSREYNEERWRSFGRSGAAMVTGRTLIRMANEHGAGINLNGPAALEEFDVIAEDPAPAAEEDKPQRFQVLPAHEFTSRPAPAWIIKHVLPKAELVVLFGASGSGKTFMALDMGAAIARGVDWRGKRVKQGRVVYIAAEGAGGFRNRLVAYAQQHKVALNELNLGVIHAAPNLLEKVDALDVARAIQASGGADVVIVDTFAQTTPGANENAGEDMGKALAHCKGIHRATGAVVVLVHHAGKDPTRGARGWSGLRAAADAELEVVREPSGRMLRLSKQKDGEDELAWGFDLEVVEIGVDEDLEPITSCVVIEAALPSGQPTRKLGPVELVVNEVIQEFAQAGTAGIEVKHVIEEAVKRLPQPPEGAKRDTRKQRINRALKTLTEGDESIYLLEDDGTITVM